MLTYLTPHIVEKPWGRTDIPAAFGDFGGRRIGEVWFNHPLGELASIQVKFLFTSERLSVQAHPGEQAAQKKGLPRGKDECWLVLEAEPSAEIGIGLSRATTTEHLRRSALDGSIVELVDWRQVAEHDFIYSPAGTIHALGAGLMVVEVQQNLDCTYRLYDYGRARDLHLEEGLDVAQAGPVHDTRDCRLDPKQSQSLVSGPHFHVRHLAGPHDHASLPQLGPEFTFVPLSSGCTVRDEAIQLGQAVLIDDPRAITMITGARALLCWAA